MNLRVFLAFIIILSCLSITPLIQISAQISESDLNSIDFSKIKVDEISDDQIRQLLNKANENGLTQRQIETIALSKGMTQIEIQKLRMRINSVQTFSPGRNNTSIAGQNRIETPGDKRTDLKPEDLFSGILHRQSDSITYQRDPRTKIFGYSLFNTKNLTFEPSINMPTPVHYVIGPGDEIDINIWGASQQTYNLVVTPEGYIVIDDVGPVMINGLSIEEATKKITTSLYSIYSGMRGSNPSTHAQVSLGNLRSIKVVVLGEVYLPGSYTLSSLSHAFNALYLSGGPGINGSLRNIDIIRNNKVIDSIDVYDFLFRGDIQKNILLNDQDIIKIDPYDIRVKITGEVKRPLIYEMRANEVLSDLIRFAGGFSDKAYSNRIKIVRNTDREKQILDVSSVDFSSTFLRNGDSVVVEPILKRFANRVEIRGAVYRPGEYSIMDSLSLLQLIEKAEGLKGDAFLSRALIIRTRNDYMLETIPVDMSSLMNGSFRDIKLQREDIVTVPSIFDMQEEYYVQIDGDVRKPGKYPFVYNSTIEDIILQAGGFLESASMARLEIARRVKESENLATSNKVANILYYQISKDLKLSDAAKSLVLEPFDRLFIRRSPGYEEQITAFIQGEVLFPGEYSISNKDERISDIINRSGGLTQDAYPKGARLIRVFQVNEKERARALHSGELLRRDYLNQIETASNDPLNNRLPNERKLYVLDSLIVSASQFKTEETIGIDLELILKNPHTKYDLILQEGDRLVVPKLLQTVSLRGELLHPITARYDRRYKFLNYIRNAGGYTSTAKRSKSYVIYANGSVDITRSFMGIKNYPKLEPGAEIIVPKRNEAKKLTSGEVISISSAFASMALILVTLINTL